MLVPKPSLHKVVSSFENAESDDLQEDHLQELQEHLEGLVRRAFDENALLTMLNNSGMEDITTFQNDSYVLLGYPKGERPGTKLDMI